MKDEKIINQEEQKQIATYLEAIQGLSESTDDYLYLWEIREDRMWIFGDVTAKYNLISEEKAYCTVKNWEEIIYYKDLPAFKKEIQRIIDGKSKVRNVDYRLLDKSGKRVWISCRGKTRPDEYGDSLVMIGRISETALRYKVDEVTGMFNAAKFNEDMERDVLKFEEGFLLLISIDNLKTINIGYGYEYGNRALRLLADLLEAETDFKRTYHLEKACFGVFLPDANKEEIAEFYKKIQRKVSSYFEISGGATSVESMSGKDSGKLYQYAEYALERAKQKGKNQLEFFDEEDYQKELAIIGLKQELENSIKKGCTGFYLVYQPQVKTGTYRLFGAEVLLRYDSPTYGRVMPSEFIPILEENEQICEVGLWVLRTALEQCRKWREKMPEFHVSVNLSPVQLKQKNIMGKVLEVLKESGVPGNALTLELTESMQLQNLRYYNEVFCAWKKAGIKIAVDDFGTGYSNLGYLKHLKVDEIKIDRCFVSGIHKNSYNYRLLYSVMEWVEGTGMRVCCEGVEEKEELQVLEELKPDLLQGYFFSKPCDSTLFERMYFKRDTQDYQDYQKYIEEMQKKHFKKLMKLKHSDILKSIDLGLWVIRIDSRSGESEMYVDDTMLRILGADSDLSPEECYYFWYDRIRPDCYDYVNASVEQCISEDAAIQIQYIWQHPELGEVEVCCAATCTENSDGVVFMEGYHRMVNNIEMSRFTIRTS